MKTSYIILILVIALLALAGYFYFTLKTKVKNVSEIEPYSKILHKKHHLERDVLLVKNIKHNVFEKDYLIVENTEILEDEIVEKHLIKRGAEIEIINAKLFKNGTSGFTTSVVIGKIMTTNGLKEFEYVWGDQHIVFNNENKEYWTFSKPIWGEYGFNPNKKYYFKSINK